MSKQELMERQTYHLWISGDRKLLWQTIEEKAVAEDKPIARVVWSLLEKGLER